jgi:HAMP domain-containing protein
VLDPATLLVAVRVMLGLAVIAATIWLTRRLIARADSATSNG